MLNKCAMVLNGMFRRERECWKTYLRGNAFVGKHEFFIEPIERARLAVAHNHDWREICKAHSHKIRKGQEGNSLPNAEVIAELIKNSADIDQPNENGATSVFMAAQNGHHDCIILLKESGANVNRLTLTGASPVYVVIKAGVRLTDDECYAIAHQLLGQGGLNNVRNAAIITSNLVVISRTGEMTQSLFKDIRHSSFRSGTATHDFYSPAPVGSPPPTRCSLYPSLPHEHRRPTRVCNARACRPTAAPTLTHADANARARACAQTLSHSLTQSLLHVHTQTHSLTHSLTNSWRRTGPPAAGKAAGAGALW